VSQLDYGASSQHSGSSLGGGFFGMMALFGKPVAEPDLVQSEQASHAMWNISASARLNLHFYVCSHGQTANTSAIAGTVSDPVERR